MSTYLLGSLGRAQNRDFEEFRLSGFYWIQTTKRLSYDKNDLVTRPTITYECYWYNFYMHLKN